MPGRRRRAHRPRTADGATTRRVARVDEFEPEKFRDEYREQVLDLIERKAAGEEIVAEPMVEAPAKVLDLVAALEASLEKAQAAKERHPSGAGTSEARRPRPKADQGPGQEPKSRQEGGAKAAAARRRDAVGVISARALVLQRTSERLAHRTRHAAGVDAERCGVLVASHRSGRRSRRREVGAGFER